MNHPMQRLTGGTASRRHVLALMGLGAAAIASGGALAACSKPPSSGGAATDTTGLDAILPKYQPLSLVKPDIPGTRPVADGFLTYPSNLVDAITAKPGTSGQKVTAMTPWWGPDAARARQQRVLRRRQRASWASTVDFSVQDGNTYADKLTAILGARDVPDLLCIPSWEYPKIPRFSEAVKTLFEDLTDHLKGDAVLAYPMLANLPTEAWRHAVWGGRLVAVPWPNDGTPFPWALFYRKDLFDAPVDHLPEDHAGTAHHRQAGHRPGQGRVGVQRHLRHGADVPQGARQRGRLAAQRRRQPDPQVRDAGVPRGARVHRQDLQGRPGPPRPRRLQGRRRQAAVPRRQDPLHAGRPGCLAGHAAGRVEGHPDLQHAAGAGLLRLRRRPAAVAAPTRPSSTPSSRRACPPDRVKELLRRAQLGAPRRWAPRSSSCASTARRAPTSPGPPTAPRP